MKRAIIVAEHSTRSMRAVELPVVSLARAYLRRLDHLGQHERAVLLRVIEAATPPLFTVRTDDEHDLDRIAQEFENVEP